MKKICFATHNADKLREIKNHLKDLVEIVGLEEFPEHEAPEETEETLEGNAQLKSMDIYNRYNITCFADDTGLEVMALNGQPGVRSARFAGEDASYNDNVDLLLEKLKGEVDRRAQFKTVIALTLADGKTLFFEGVCRGEITEKRQGEGGFGYDPIFLPEGQQKTFAEMTLSEKNEISHRGRAVKMLIKYLTSVRDKH